MKYILTFFITYSLLLDAHAQERYRSYNPRFSIEIPINWVKEKPKGPNVNLLLIDKKSGSTIVVLILPNSNSRFRDAHDLTVEELSKELNIDNEEKVIGFKKTYINQEKAVCLTTQYRWRSMGVDTLMKSVSYTIFRNERAYHITAGGESLNFDRMKPVFDQAISSFVIEDGFYSSIDTTANETYISMLDNFSINFDSKPNVDSKENLTTYSITSLNDTAIYRISVLSNLKYFTNKNDQNEFINAYLSEYVKQLNEKNIKNEYSSILNKKCLILSGEILLYGEIPMLGEKAFWKSIAFISKDKLYTLTVTSTSSNLNTTYNRFINSFKLLY